MGLSRFAARCIAIGAALMLLGVVLGAFGAHALAERLTLRDLEVFRVGVTYQQTHSLALVLLGALARESDGTRSLQWAARAFLIGIVLFSGSLYLIVAGAPRTLGAITPFGGASFMVGWALVVVHALRAR